MKQVVKDAVEGQEGSEKISEDEVLKFCSISLCLFFFLSSPLKLFD